MSAEDQAWRAPASSSTSAAIIAIVSAVRVRRADLSVGPVQAPGRSSFGIVDAAALSFTITGAGGRASDARLGTTHRQRQEGHPRGEETQGGDYCENLPDRGHRKSTFP